MLRCAWFGEKSCLHSRRMLSMSLMMLWHLYLFCVFACLLRQQFNEGLNKISNVPYCRLPLKIEETNLCLMIIQFEISFSKSQSCRVSRAYFSVTNGPQVDEVFALFFSFLNSYSHLSFWRSGRRVRGSHNTPHSLLRENNKEKFKSNTFYHWTNYSIWNICPFFSFKKTFVGLFWVNSISTNGSVSIGVMLARFYQYGLKSFLITVKSFLIGSTTINKLLCGLSEWENRFCPATLLILYTRPETLISSFLDCLSSVAIVDYISLRV